jgi:hypothetical protein
MKNPIHGFDHRLKRCPFCKSEARADTETIMVKGKPQQSGFVECMGEDCYVIIRARTEAQAVKMWQRRAK